MPIILAWLPIAFAAATPTSPDPRRAASCTDTSLARSSYEFASNPWLNLYNFLVKEAKLARGIDDEGLGARGYVDEDTAAVRPLSRSEAASWNQAVALFARDVLPDRLQIDSLVVNVNNVLARARPDDDIEATGLNPVLRQILRDVMPIYLSAWWPSHHRRNEQWIWSMQAALADWEWCLARRAESVFRAPWPNAPIHVD